MGSENWNEEEAAVDYARALFKYGERQQRQQRDSTLDLRGVPPQPPIPKSSGRIKDRKSKYTGVSFHKQNNKWQAQIMINGKQHNIGYYDNEEEAAVDYARALFKYGESRQQRESTLDLTGVPPQPLIPKSSGRSKDGASKYTGVSFTKQLNKWQARINIYGKQHCIGYYEKEEEAAVDYARALFKYGERQERQQRALDLSNVPPLPPIPKRSKQIKEGTSKYTGVSFNKQMNKWQARINIDRKQHYIGYYDNEEEAAVDYARALFKYKGQEGQGALMR